MQIKVISHMQRITDYTGSITGRKLRDPTTCRTKYRTNGQSDIVAALFRYKDSCKSSCWFWRYDSQVWCAATTLKIITRKYIGSTVK